MLSSFCRMSLRSPTEPGIARATVDICRATLARGRILRVLQEALQHARTSETTATIQEALVDNKALQQLTPPGSCSVMSAGPRAPSQKAPLGKQELSIRSHVFKAQERKPACAA
jgi:hypothetical protein